MAKGRLSLHWKPRTFASKSWRQTYQSIHSSLGAPSSCRFCSPCELWRWVSSIATICYNAQKPLAIFQICYANLLKLMLAGSSGETCSIDQIFLSPLTGSQQWHDQTFEMPCRHLCHKIRRGRELRSELNMSPNCLLCHCLGYFCVRVWILSVVSWCYKSLCWLLCLSDMPAFIVYIFVVINICCGGYFPLC